jgi:hypothetical protein
MWTMEHASIAVDAEVSSSCISVGLILPYLRICIGVRHVYYSWVYKIENLLRRKPAIKRVEDLL